MVHIKIHTIGIFTGLGPLSIGLWIAVMMTGLYGMPWMFDEFAYIFLLQQRYSEQSFVEINDLTVRNQWTTQMVADLV